LKKDGQILMIFGMNIPDNWPSNDHLCSHLTERLFLHYLGNTKETKY